MQWPHTCKCTDNYDKSYSQNNTYFSIFPFYTILFLFFFFFFSADLDPQWKHWQTVKTHRSWRPQQPHAMWQCPLKHVHGARTSRCSHTNISQMNLGNRECCNSSWRFPIHITYQRLWDILRKEKLFLFNPEFPNLSDYMMCVCKTIFLLNTLRKSCTQKKLLS